MRRLKEARDRKRAATGRCEGRKSFAETRPDTVALAKELRKTGLSFQRSQHIWPRVVIARQKRKSAADCLFWQPPSEK
jgi:hypothetical protein